MGGNGGKKEKNREKRREGRGNLGELRNRIDGKGRDRSKGEEKERDK